MNKDILLQILKQKEHSELLAILDEAWELMSTSQRDQIFYPHISDAIYDFPAQPDKTIEAIKTFQKSTLAGDYYAPFDINSKNFMDIPEETDAWFAKMDELFIECTKLSRQKDYQAAVEGFEILHELFEGMCDHVFADELGDWMFTGDLKAYHAAYLEAASETCNPEDFAGKAMSVIIDDSHQNCSLKMYSLVKSVATEEQMVVVDGGVKERGIKVA